MTEVVRITQVTVEALTTIPSVTRVTQVATEVLASVPAVATVSQVAVEVLASVPAVTRVSQVAVEVLIGAASYRALVSIGGVTQQVPTGQENTYPPLILLNGVRKQKAAESNSPLVWDGSTVREATAGETVIV
jgi:hypothetical protein